MRIIKRSALQEAWQKHPDAERELRLWYAVANSAEWESVIDVRRTFPHADAVVLDSGHTVTVFNIKGNRYRLIVAIHYNRGWIYVREFLTHAEYSKNAWKKRN